MATELEWALIDDIATLEDVAAAVWDVAVPPVLNGTAEVTSVTPKAVAVGA